MIWEQMWFDCCSVKVSSCPMLNAALNCGLSVVTMMFQVPICADTGRALQDTGREWTLLSPCGQHSCWKGQCIQSRGDGGSGGFFLAYEDLSRMFDNSFPTRAFFFFLKWRLDHMFNFYSLGQDQAIVAQQAEMTVAEHFLTRCLRAGFLIGSHTMPAQRHSQPTWTLLGEGCMLVWVWPASCTFGRMTRVCYMLLQ